MSNIASVLGREILDSRGNPTVEVEVTLDPEFRRVRQCRQEHQPGVVRLLS